MIRRIVAVRSSLSTPWSWNSWRVVIRSVPLPIVRASSSQARYWSAVELAADDPHPDHELVGLLLPLLLELGAEVAIVLLVRAVELEDRRGVFAEVRSGRCRARRPRYVFRYWLASLIASTLLGFGPLPGAVAPSASSLARAISWRSPTVGSAAAHAMFTFW